MMKLIYCNLRQRPTRTCVSVLAVALGVALLLVCVGLSYGQLSSFAERTRRIGGDFLLQPSDASFFFAANSGTLPEKLGGVILQVEGIEAMTPILVKFLGDRFHMVYGIEPVSFRQMNRSLRLVQGRFFQGPRELLVDTLYARTRQLKVGDSLEILGENFLISGIFEAGVAARVLLPLKTLQELNGTPDKVTMFFVAKRPEVSEDQALQSLKERFAHYKITRTADLEEIVTSTTPVYKEFVAAMVAIAAVISFLIILLSMYSTIVERTREIGILKSLGASKSYIVHLIVEESLVICSLGVTGGFLLAWLAIELILAGFPNLPVEIPLYWKLLAVVMAVASGTLGALYPAVKAARLDPVKALGYE